ncbi:16S rRNA m(7)G-527 methyltransferase [Acetitomaculum ruminis DSM 5522]|uniref:Ribosomal RNA small subunit methyltransferase G n=1 Tax=Acetitomaculum ruminis DSM 5522 TaxID=1120918 RepID=A0A1I0ZDB1_9FIRM|nr:16S rRNA (guanine(527)-N(7))-methyltransferase RsmG [Acetitomaculum ruminis]SFB23605.1 16S rRNA m(7)G-527 methyltransferase [Acetitomaculum ruminis DSM 5522]
MDNNNLIEKFKKWEFVIDEEKADKLNAYYQLLIEWNSKMNLTAITDYDDVCIKHFFDSVSLLKYIDLKEGQSVVDIGTGAGFPGIPLKILRPDVEFVLIDSLNKRINFLNYVIKELGLSKIKAIHSRAEETGKNLEYREKFDFCVSRAVARLPVLCEYTIPLVKKGGYFISYKSIKTEDEIKEANFAIDILGGKIDKIENFMLPDTDMVRNLVFIKKVKNTGSKFPRNAAMIKKSPLVK